MVRAPEMRDVELVEPGPAGPAAPPAAVAPGRRPAGPPGEPSGAPAAPALAAAADRDRDARRRAGRGAMALVLLALGAAGAVLGTGLRESARIARLAEVPGVAAPIDGPVRVAWQLPGTQLAPPRWLDGTVVGVVRSRDGGVDVAAMDGGTGAELWRTPVSPPGQGSDPSAACEVPGPPAAGDRSGGGARDDRDDPGVREARVLACVVVEDTDTAGVAGVGSATYPTRTRLVVLDAATGDVRSDRAVPASTRAVVLGSDLLLGHVADDGHLHLARVGLPDGVARWSFRSPDPVPADELGQRGVDVQADDDLVLADAGPGWVLTADGDLVHSWPTAERSPRQPPVARLLEGRGAVVRLTVDAVGAATGEVVDVRTGRTFEIAGYPTPLRPDDGSRPDLLLVDRTDGAGRTAYDLRTGREVWTSPEPPGGAEALLDGRLLGVAGDTVRATDVRTGRPVWSTPLGAPGLGSLVTDGRVVVVTSMPATGPARVAAYDVDDGRERWSTRLRTDAFLDSVDGALYGFTRDGVVVVDSGADGD